MREHWQSVMDHPVLSYLVTVPAFLLVVIGGFLMMGYGVAALLDVLPEGYTGETKWISFTALAFLGGWIAAQWYAGLRK